MLRTVYVVIPVVTDLDGDSLEDVKDYFDVAALDALETLGLQGRARFLDAEIAEPMDLNQAAPQRRCAHAG